jgi:hypothetical protein
MTLIFTERINTRVHYSPGRPYPPDRIMEWGLHPDPPSAIRYPFTYKQAHFYSIQWSHILQSGLILTFNILREDLIRRIWWSRANCTRLHHLEFGIRALINPHLLSHSMTTHFTERINTHVHYSPGRPYPPDMMIACKLYPTPPPGNQCSNTDPPTPFYSIQWPYTLQSLLILAFTILREDLFRRTWWSRANCTRLHHLETGAQTRIHPHLFIPFNDHTFYRAD